MCFIALSATHEDSQARVYVSLHSAFGRFCPLSRFPFFIRHPFLTSPLLRLFFFHCAHSLTFRYTHPGQAARRQRLEEAIEARDRRRAARVEARRNNRTSTTSSPTSIGGGVPNRKSSPPRNVARTVAGPVVATATGATASRKKSPQPKRAVVAASSVQEE